MINVKSRDMEESVVLETKTQRSQPISNRCLHPGKSTLRWLSWAYTLTVQLEYQQAVPVYGLEPCLVNSGISLQFPGPFHLITIMLPRLRSISLAKQSYPRSLMWNPSRDR